MKPFFSLCFNIFHSLNEVYPILVLHMLVLQYFNFSFCWFSPGSEDSRSGLTHKSVYLEHQRFPVVMSLIHDKFAELKVKWRHFMKNHSPKWEENGVKQFKSFLHPSLLHLHFTFWHLWLLRYFFLNILKVLHLWLLYFFEV